VSPVCGVRVEQEKALFGHCPPRRATGESCGLGKPREAASEYPLPGALADRPVVVVKVL
jgi:hypothetical protein